MVLLIPSISCGISLQLLFCKEKVLAYNQYNYCHVVVCLWLILFHLLQYADWATESFYLFGLE